MTKLNQSASNKIAVGITEPPPQYVLSQRPLRVYADSVRPTWRQNASIEDWKEYLFSAPPSPVNVQTPQIQHRPMTPYICNVEASGHNPNLRKYIPEHSQLHFNNCHQSLDGSQRAVEQAASRLHAGNRRVTGRQANPRTNWYQNRAEQKRGRSQYYNFSPKLIRYVDPTQLEKKQPICELDYVELFLFNPNRNGYITLDDKAVGILVNAIDKALPKNLNLKLLAESISND